MSGATADLRYPTGKFQAPQSVTPEQLAEWIQTIAALPAELAAAVDHLSDEQLDTPYRDGGWTLRQVVHHVADSHLNSQLRFRFALTEDQPTIRPYQEALWAELFDAKTAPVQVSLDFVRALHDRWVRLLRSLTPEQFARSFNHPVNGIMRLDTTTGLYAWHGRHHVAHIRNLRRDRGW